MPPPPGIAGAFFSGFSATIASVVTSRPATEAASCNAVRTTLVGSTMPAFTRTADLDPVNGRSDFVRYRLIEPYGTTSRPSPRSVRRGNYAYSNGTATQVPTSIRT